MTKKEDRNHEQPTKATQDSSDEQPTKATQDSSDGQPTKATQDSSDEQTTQVAHDNDDEQNKKVTCDNSNKSEKKKIDQPQRHSKANQDEVSNSNLSNVLGVLAIASLIGYVSWYYASLNPAPAPLLYEKHWRLKVDPYNQLESDKRNIIRAALKPILDKSSTSESNSISTLIIISSNEEYAARIGRCILQLVNTKNYANSLSTEIDVPSYVNNKIGLDKKIRALLSSNDANRAVLLRRIDNISSNAIELARLLFAYCDGENPVITDRLFIMTATSDGTDESDLREKFKQLWSNEHDFVDALMARISGHILYIEDDQKSIC